MAKKSTKNQYREQVRKWLRWGSRAGLSLLVLSSTIYSVLLVRDAVEGRKIFHLRDIQFEGVEKLDTAGLGQLIKETFSPNLLNVDLHRVRMVVEAEEWVESAVVRRQLPDQLQIRIVERIPVAVAAVGDGLYIVDRTGITLASFGGEYAHLEGPIVKGLRSTALENASEENHRRMTLYLEALEALRGPGEDFLPLISEIDVEDVERVALIRAADPIPIFLGDRDFRARFQTFVDNLALYEDVKASAQSLESVDVTYDNKIIIHKGDSGANNQQETSG